MTPGWGLPHPPAVDGPAAPALVTVVVPTLNSGRTLARCLRGIRAQSYPAVESVIVDGGSFDATDRTVAEVAPDSTFLRTRLRRSSARRLGAETARGEYLLFIDADQVPAPRLVENCVAVAAKTDCAAIRIPESIESTGVWGRCMALDRRLLRADALSYPRFFRTSVYRSIGGHSQNLEDYMEDRALFLRLEASGFPIAWSREHLTNVLGTVNPIELGRKGMRAAGDAGAYYRETAPLRDTMWKMVGLRARSIISNAKALDGELSLVPVMPIYALCAYGPRFTRAAMAASRAR